MTNKNETETAREKIEEIIGIDDFKNDKRKEIEFLIKLLLKETYIK